jgi:large repetitive protein
LRFTNSQVNTSEIPLTSSITLQQFLSSHNFNLQNTTIPTWTEFLTGTTPFNLNIEITDLPTGQLAEANITRFDPTGLPTSGTLTLDTDANGLGWFIDGTPWDNAEFGTLNAETFFRATLGSAAYGHYDLLTTILHELGHLAGLISGNPTYDSRITNINGTPTFQGNGYSTPLTQDRSHLADPTKLMGTYLAPGMRKLPSPLELQMLADLRNTPANSSIHLATRISARQEATPMLGITNGQFDQLLTQWDTRGSIQVTNANLTLREDDPLLAHLSQTFVIPNGAKTLQFTLTDAYLDQSPLNPGDTFEVALLNAQTLQSLVGPISNLTQTDSLLNLQNSGQLYRTTATYLSDLPDSDDRANAFRLARPRTITIDLTTVPANTLALLSFALLSFGSQNGYVTIDDVRLFTDTNTPIAQNDQQTLLKGIPTTLNLLANDQASDGSPIVNGTIELGTLPQHGSLSRNPDGSYTYSPAATYLGTDSFTYAVKDATGRLSNPATVTLTMIDAAPVITSLTLAPNFTEGTPANFSAIATEGTNTALTYSWNFGDGSDPLLGQSVQYTYADNGLYTVTLTVSSDQGSTTATRPIAVTNAAPIVNAGPDAAIAEGSAIAFNGQATDAGILDAPTYSWNFGDASTPVTGTLKPSHTYLDNGSYTVTLTVTDKDGASTQDAFIVTVNNVAPTITSLNGDLQIIEGKPATFTATATDAGADTLTYGWNFGDGSALVTGPTLQHTFADNGTYAVILTVTDDDGASTSQTLNVQVLNAAPTVNAGLDRTINEGQTLTFAGEYLDPGILDTHTLSWTFGDGSAPVTGTLTPAHLFKDDGSYTVTLTVTDKDGASTSDQLIVLVRNVNPTITNLTGNTTVNEGSLTAFSAVATDPGTDTLTYSWNFGDGSNPVLGDAVSHIYGDNGTYTVTLTVTDEDGGSTTQTLAVNVVNVAPTVNAGADQTLYLDETVTLSGDYTDPGFLDTHTVIWNFGDGTSQTGTLNPTHTYTTPGLYNLSFNVTDDDGGTNTDSMTVRIKPLPTIAISNLTLTEGDTGSQSAVFTVTLSEVSTRPVTVNFATANGTAIAGSDYVATSGSLTFIPGQTSQIVTVAITGDVIDENDETFFLNLSTPSNATIATAQATGTIVDNDLSPTISVTDRTITEGDSGSQLMTFTINLSGASAKAITVNYATANGTAIAGKDYVATSGTLTFTPGQTSQTVTVQVNGDVIDENDETFFLDLSTPSNATIAQAQAVATIIDNDPAPTLSITSQSITEGNSGTQTMTFTVTLSGASEKPITVNYGTNNGTATAGSDYTVASGTLTFNPGETTKTIGVTVLADTINEANETFAVVLTNPTNATIATATGTGTILNDDPAITAANFAIITEGTFRSNGALDLDGVATNLNDDARVYAAKGFDIKGNATLPIKYQANGQPLLDAQGRQVLIDNAIAVGANYTQSSINGSGNYAGLNPPPIVPGITVTVPTFADLKQQELTRRVPTGTPETVLNIVQTPLTATNWTQLFPAAGTATQPRIVRITGGSLTIPNGVTINNTIIIVDSGNITFANNATLNNVALIANIGSISLANVQAKDTSVLASSSITMNGASRFDGATLIANGTGNLTFNGATKLNDSTQNLTVVSQGNLTFNGAQNSRGTFISRGEFLFNGSSQLYGAIRAKGDVRFNGGGTVVAV